MIRPNSAPNASGESYTSRAARFQGGIQFSPPAGLLLNDSDPDGDQLSFGGVVTYPANGSLSIPYSGGSFQYGPYGGFVGTDSFVYRVCDPLGACSQATATVHANDAPNGVADNYVVIQGQGFATYQSSTDIRLLVNDSDPDGDPIRVTGVVTYPTNGSVSIPYSEGTFIYGPNAGFSGYDSFTYNVCDNFGACTPTKVNLYVIAGDDANNAGYSCPAKQGDVGEPINVTNGNMWIEQTDYSLAGIGENIEIKRFYNSVIQTSGLFGKGWATAYDESIGVYGDKMIRLNMPDGRAVYFGRTNTTDPFSAISPEIYGQIVRNVDNTYTLTYKDGRVHKFSSGGKLLWQTDRNGNQTTLTYDVNGNLAGIADAFGRTLTVTTNLGFVTQLSDSLGVVANYIYNPNGTLQSVTYADGSKYQFEYTTINSKIYLTTVKDALNNILETHQYDSSGRATTSEKQGGVEKYTLNYSSSTYTTVTDALGRITKYYFDKSKGRNVVTKIEGNCNCGSGSEITQYFYDQKLNLTKKVDALGRQMLYTFDSNGNRLSMTDVLGTETYTYNSFGEILTRTDRMNGITTNTYNATGNLLTTKDALNNVTTLTYDVRGQILTVKDALNQTTTLAYDTQGRLIEVKDANNKTTNFAYDVRARLTDMTNAVNQTTNFQYDLNNRLKKIIYADATFEESTYTLFT